jgi:S-adenosylmethionine synthetase
MASRDFIFTSESVSEGHPDKVADQISDAVLDAILTQDPKGRVACETLVTTGMALIAGEITTEAYVDMPRIVRDTIRDIGYTDSSIGFDCHTCAVLTSIDQQSPDIAIGVSEGQGLYTEQGAGDQGLMFGYACDQTDEMMPMPIVLAHRLVRRLSEVRKAGIVGFFRPDGKSQVTVQYVDGRPKRIDTIVVSTQHDAEASWEHVREAVVEAVVKPTMPAGLLDAKTSVLVNPTGRFVVGGPMGDCGVTGRKIIVDTYGGWARHGGGAFSGKDPSKVDRSAAYFARYAAKNVVAAGLARECEIQVAYAIGVAKPVSIRVDTFGTASRDDAAIARAVAQVFDFWPKAIIETLDLLRPIYKATAAYGHLGRTGETFTWERTDRTEALLAAL